MSPRRFSSSTVLSGYRPGREIPFVYQAQDGALSKRTHPIARHQASYQLAFSLTDTDKTSAARGPNGRDNISVRIWSLSKLVGPLFLTPTIPKAEAIVRDPEGRVNFQHVPISQWHKPVYTIDFRAGLCEFLHMRPRQRSEPESIVALQQFYKEVGARVREARKRANNMTQKALAMTVGLTRTSLTNIEKGRQKMLLHTFTDIAIALGVDVADLLPRNEKILTGLEDRVLASLLPEERGFIERAVGVGGSYENKQTTTNTNGSKRIAGNKPNNQRTR